MDLANQYFLSVESDDDDYELDVELDKVTVAGYVYGEEEDDDCDELEFDACFDIQLILATEYKPDYDEEDDPKFEEIGVDQQAGVSAKFVVSEL
ncbi:MAG: hypothetical protein EZS28_013082 [Streblomastix strix]|uniref:Uncharacterized protein n=1 Tax=Streblomastix strix TaxID=222440 RepID=A0A5J4WAI0_9EUKA|nr:MAG: hypothetical protein EZS28_013082 [Streblomastix strix]